MQLIFIDILAGVDSLTLKSNATTVMKRGGNDTDTTTFVFEESEPASVSCHIRGGNPKPWLHIYRGNQDISEQFDRKESVSVLGKPGLQYVVHDTMLSTKHFEVLPEHRGEMLKCVAKIQHFPNLRSSKIRGIELKCE